MNNFVHLHVHTDASFLDGMILPSKLVARAKELGMPAVAVTDHGNMSNIIEFYREAKKAGIKPIIGCEVYIEEGNSHLVLLAKNNTGYKRLNELVFMSYKNFYRKPRIKIEWLEENSEGLIALSACLAGVVSRAITNGNGLEKALQMKRIFGDDFYLEVQANKIPKQRVLNKQLYAISEQTGIKVVGTIDAHFLTQEDREAHRNLLKIPNMKVTATYTEAYLKTREEMEEELPGIVLDNTLEVADKCNVEIDTSVKMPRFSETQDADFRKELEKNAPLRIPDTPEYRDRLAYEVGIIERMNYQGYFMVLHDVISWCGAQGIRRSPGRGSAAGSLVSYVLGITNIDPIEHGLLFERFLNPDRVSLPDIDIDIPTDKRQLVLDHVEEKYGSEYVAKIMAMSKLKPRSVFKDMARIMDVSFKEANTIGATIPQEAQTMAEAAELSDDFAVYYKSHKKMMDICERLIGVTRQATVHAAGVVISPVPILDVVTMKYDKEAGQVIAVDKGSVEYVGLVKMDFLGLDTLTLFDKAGVDTSSIDLEDPKVLELFRNGDTDAIFQFESTGMKELLQNIGVSSFGDIVAANALYRPGPLESGLTEQFVENKKSGKLSIPFSELEDILSPTYGVLCYQEQVMESAVTIGGITRSEADILRKAIGKKNKELMDQIISKITEGALRKGHIGEAVIDFFEKVKKFARYSFNKSHAAAYAKLAVIAAHLKIYYPARFYAAAISVWAKRTDKVYHLILGARRAGLAVLPPDINSADEDAKPIGDYAVMLGFSNLKGVGESAISSIMANRPYSSLFNFMLKNSSVNISNVKAMIYAGSFFTLKSRKEDLELSANIYAKMLKSGGRNMLVSIANGSNNIDQPLEKSIATWTKKERMQHEFSSFGFYLSETPLDRYGQIIDSMLYRNLSVVEDMRITSTRKDKSEMCILKLTDYMNSTEVPVFPRMWEEVKGTFKKEDVVLTKYDDNGNVISILPVDGKVDPKQIVIAVNDSTSLPLIRKICAQYPGGLLPTLEIEGEEVPATHSVKYDVSMMQSLNRINGVSAKAFF